jgi:hypothetical protein
VPETALGTVDRILVFNDLQIDHLPNKQEVGPTERSRPCFRRPRLLNLEETTNYIIDYSAPAFLTERLQPYDLVIVS